MITISKQYSFDSAHQLMLPTASAAENKELFGKCASMHGHTYLLTVVITGPLQARTGMIMNYFDLDKVMRPLVETWDHKFLNDVFPELSGRTTAENMVNRMAYHISHQLQIHGPRYGYDSVVKLAEVKLQETPKTTAIWRLV